MFPNGNIVCYRLGFGLLNHQAHPSVGRHIERVFETWLAERQLGLIYFLCRDAFGRGNINRKGKLQAFRRREFDSTLV